MNLLTIQLLSAEAMPFGERVAYALRMLIVGLGAVFAVLALLWGVLVVARIFLHDMPMKKKQGHTKQVPVTHTAPVKQPTVQAPPSAPAVRQENGVLIAVITAAVSAAMAEEGTLPTGGFRVVSFRRANESRTWNRQ